MPRPTANRTLQLATEPKGQWVQVERLAMEKFAKLTVDHPRASALLQIIISRMGRGNALVASQPTLAKLAGCTDRTIRRALDVLKAGNWLEVRQLGPSGTACAYIVNSRVAWEGKRDGIRFAEFTATVLVADFEQPDRDELGNQPALVPLPSIFPGEQQLPTGPGLPPPADPALPGLEPDLPVRKPR